MARITQQEATKGSQYWLQKLVNNRPELIDRVLRKKLELNTRYNINWLAPLRTDHFAEYKDEAFLKLLSVNPEIIPLYSFWPHGGAVWDGLGKTDRGDILLVEAKAYASELKSDGCLAIPPSLDLIKRSLDEASKFFGAKSSENWTGQYYQYANRLAHLYFLRKLNNIPASLIFIYFVNAVEMNGPKSIQEWQPAIEDIHKELGIDSARLAPYVVDIFIDVTMHDL